MLLQALSGVDQNLKDQGLSTNVALQSALDTQFLLQIGVFTAVPMIMNFVLEEGILKVRNLFNHSSSPVIFSLNRICLSVFVTMLFNLSSNFLFLGM